MFEFVQNNKFVIKVILGAIALTFVGFGVGSYTTAVDEPYLAKVGNVKIHKQDLDRALEGQPADAATRQAVLENLIRQQLLLADSHAAGLTVSDAQLRKAIAAIPALQENGTFSPERYKQFLAGRYQSSAAFEELVKRDILLQGQLTSLLGSQIVPRTVVDRMAGVLGESREVRALVLKPEAFAAEVKTDDTALKAFYDASLKRFRTPEAIKLDYVVLSQDALAAAQAVTDQEVESYYNEHKADFGSEERRVSHILLTVPPKATAEQKAKVRSAAEALLKEVRANPAKFAELAKTRSQDPGSATNGGDLGFFGRGAMVKPFEDVAFRMQPGQISEVVETEFGFHILKLEEVKQPVFTAVKGEVEQRLKRQKAAAQFRAASEKLGELAYQQADSLKAISDQLKLSPQHSDWLVRGKPASDPLLNNPKLQEAAFSDDVLKGKHNSEPVDLGKNTLVVVRVAEHQPERQQTLAEVQEVIKAELVRREGAKLAEKRGDALLAELKAGKNVDSHPWEPARMVSRRSFGALSLSEVRAVFAASATKLPAFTGVKQDGGNYVVYRVDKVVPAQAPSPAERSQLSGLIGEMNANAQVASYLEALREKYKVTLSQQPTE
ncbi:SurA N-terminal domain-containing protein [Pseudogulbenkiania subflava]|uniref:Periplasmic chaperone PpiD n=1 Tax=Pseudogulbenkiania subflava DSM 22618 TaxID=1123014 RepID=A0A1Y6C3L9_9NEIS|nr:SurA N-terminal domain-containing protein [Pseudogulbenkiania subflava]SMF43873.1 peptidyl-prolyl cis-trans isomerase D [Pseudogulbenkiania subflava DSM 22618]